LLLEILRPDRLCSSSQNQRTTNAAENQRVECLLPFTKMNRFWDGCITSMDTIPVVGRTALLLILSNIFMTFAWYGHLKNLQQAKWYIAALASWSIALFEYLLQVPANRIGYTQLSVAQLKIMQEVITLSVFVPFSLFYMQQPLKVDYLWAGLCLVGAVYFIFRA